MRLKAGVIPSQNLPPADVPEYVPGKKRQCAILECKNTSKDGISLHNFPRKSASRDQWKTLCGLKRANRRTFICSEHFQDTNFSKFIIMGTVFILCGPQFSLNFFSLLQNLVMGKDVCWKVQYLPEICHLTVSTL